MHQTLYRKYRPATFGEVVGQEHIVPVLEYEVSGGKTTHAYLFCGSRGTGKTSCAKILAKAVNCLSPVNGSPCGECEACRMIDNGTATDVVEMDAASNTGVDYIRDIKDTVAYPPTMLKNRVYIIDEVHMLSAGAFNALLKTLEEPPPHVIFILATTELHKVPATILSRCQRFDFRRISIPVLIGRLREIAGKEQITVSDDALLMMARNARGGMRDAISLLELCAGGGEEITAKLVREKIGIGGREMLENAFLAIYNHDYNAVFSLIDSLYGSAIDISAFWQELIGFCRDLLVVRSVTDPTRFIDATSEEFRSLSSIAEKFSKEKLVWIGNVLDEAQNSMQRTSDSKRVIAEMALIRLCDERMSDSTPALIARIAALEEKLDAVRAGAVFSAPPKKENPAAPVPETAETEEITSPVPETKPEEPQETSMAAAPVPSAAETAFDMLPELVEKVGRTDEAAATMLRMAGIFVCGNKLKIRVGDMFSGMLLGGDDRKKLIAESLRMLPGFDGISDSDIAVEVAQKKEEADPFADIG